MNVLGKTQKNTILFLFQDKNKVKLIDGTRFNASSLINLVDDLAEGIDKVKCEYYDGFLKYESVKNKLMKTEYLSCNKNYSSN